MCRTVVITLLFIQGWMGVSQAETAGKVYHAPFYPGERIVYVAEYMSMEVARVEFQIVEIIDTLNTTLFHARAIIQSNPGVPLIFVRDQYDAYFDMECRPYLHIGKGQRRNYAFRLQYRFDQETGTITGWEYRQKGFEEKLRGKYEAPLEDGIFDPLTLFYYIRTFLKNVMSYERLKLQVFTNGKSRRVEVRPRHQMKKVRLVKQELLVFPLDLKLKFKGIAGIRDLIKFVMSADQKVIPVDGELRFMLGKMRIRLAEYIPGKLPFVQSADKSSITAPASR